MQIEVGHLSLALGGNQVLDDVSFSVPDGAFACVLGESGAGKSTVLRVIEGLAVQDAGFVTLGGQPADGLPTARRGVAMVFQDSRLFPNMSVAENVCYPLRVRGVRAAERRARADELLREVQLPGYGDRRTNALSGGQRQRVALARALCGEPGAILLDEPFSGLDVSLRQDMRDLVLGLHQKFGTTMLMVTHDPLEALTMSDEVVVLSRGRLVQVGTPADILLRPASAAVGRSFPATCVLEGHVQEGVFASGKLRVPCEEGVSDGPALLLRSSDGTVRVLPR
jgi:putative spermidine/putrescine transport system ATP-binding protein